jgi:hypothetical protein
MHGQTLVVEQDVDGAGARHMHGQTLVVQQHVDGAHLGEEIKV